MLKKVTFLGCILSLLFSCMEQSSYHIKVNLTNLEPQEVYAVLESEMMKTAETYLYDGNGELVLSPKEGDYRTLTLYYDNFSKWVTVYLEDKRRLVVSGDAATPHSVQVKGGGINDLLSDFKKETALLLDEYTSFADSVSAEQLAQQGVNRMTRLANIRNELRLQAEAFILKHPDEKASAILIKDYFVDPDNHPQIEALLATLMPELSGFYVVQELKEYVEKAKQTAIGAKAPDFNVMTINGDRYTRDSFSDGYLLLAFTYLWEDMCHTNHLHLDKIISSYPKDSLHVLLVTLDEQPQHLRDSTGKEKIKWDIVTDSLGQSIKLLDTYNINALPRSFLIDRTGNIVMRTDNGVELQQTLDKLMPPPESRN
ncbi:MAG: TlpA family protein disulfide reductase [Tannerella sp.]|jgi:peroxiredoxin|nr:TlpA family protein disulfide reductase [Tannerella sp.]